MKNFKVSLFATILGISGQTSLAQSTATQLFGVRVTSVRVETVNDPANMGSISQRVTATVEYGNSCEASASSEAFIVNKTNVNSRTLNITLASLYKTTNDDVPTACPAIYSPVSRDVLLGDFSHPADGRYSKIIVNGVVAKAQSQENQPVCTMNAGVLVSKSTGECRGFTNGCQEGALLAEGFRYPTAGECGLN